MNKNNTTRETMKKAIIFLALIFIGNLSQAQSNPNITTTTTTKASATLAATCTISAQNVNFGQVSLPVGAQSATSSMTIECNKGASYTIGLAYGGIYGQGTNGGGDYWVHEGCPTTCTPYYNWYYEFNSAGTQINAVQLANDQGANIDLATENVPGATWNAATGTYVVGTTPYLYGMLIGASSGDKIAYSIQVPNNPSEVWNAGENNYSSSAIGSIQSIPVVATLVPGQTPEKYPTADTYIDTVTATIQY
jgi:spore coat protein U-like protein